MCKVKAMLIERPFVSQSESLYSLCRRLEAAIDDEFNNQSLPDESKMLLKKIQEAAKEVIANEDTNSRVQ